MRADKVQRKRKHRLDFAHVLVESQLGQCLRAPLALTPPPLRPTSITPHLCLLPKVQLPSRPWPFPYCIWLLHSIA
jgi:hypothetical protein